MSSNENNNSLSRQLSGLFTYKNAEKTAALTALILFVLPLIYSAICLILNVMYSYSEIYSGIIILCTVLAGATFILLIGDSIKQKRNLRNIITSNIPMLFFAGFLLLMLISAAVNGAWIEPDFAKPLPCEDLQMYISFFAVFLFCGCVIRTAKIKRTLITVFCVTSLVMSLLVIADYYFVDLTPMQITAIDNVAPSAVFRNSNHYGYYLSISLILNAGLFIYAESRKLRIFGLISFAVQTAVTVINDTFGSYLGTAAGLIFMFIIHWIVTGKPGLKALAVFGIFIGITAVMTIWYDTMLSSVITLFKDIKNITSDSSAAVNAGTGRWPLWTTTIQAIAEKPLLGHGINGIADRLEMIWEGIYLPHSEYLQYAVYFGIPALIMYLAGVVSVFIRANKNKRSLDTFTLISLCAAFAYCISAIFGNTKYYTAPYFFIMLGSGYNYCKDTCPVFSLYGKRSQASDANSCDQ